ncbi:uncharacterized protein LOC115454205 [Manduca sexta]|uniref:uncharacterized protein LOC115454205 n=1 Tax=Manduca sexta TaxID=7130 RepID=UPI00188DCC60|nr:uncharacterized protein LOC115454205 [Manduca sexta]
MCSFITCAALYIIIIVIAITCAAVSVRHPVPPVVPSVANVVFITALIYSQNMQAYYVVKFVNFEHRASKYAFVPRSWIKILRNDNMAVIVLPTDKMSTEKRAKNLKTPAAKWKRHLCEVVYVTDVITDAVAATLRYHKKDPIPTQPATPTKESRAEKRQSTEPVSEAWTKANHEATLDHCTNTKNDITQPTTNPTNDENRDIFFTQLENYLCQLQESFTELLNVIYEYTE